MSEKIGKWHLIFGAVSILLLLSYGFLQKGILPSLQIENIPFYVLLAVPLTSALLCLLLAWIVSAQTKKSNRNEAGNKPDNNISIFFKSYLYLWTIVALAIAGAGALYHNYVAANPDSDILVAMIAMSIAWTGTIIVCILIWAAFNIWKSNEVIGVIVGLIGILLLAVTGFTTAYFYNEICTTEDSSSTYYGDYDGGDDYEAAAVEPSEDYEDYEADRVYSDYELYDNSFTFMKYKLNIESVYDPVQLLRYWKYYGWHPEYDEDRGISSYRHYRECEDCFDKQYDNAYNDSEALQSLSDFYANNLTDYLTPETYQQSGAKNLVKMLLIAREDIYSHENKNDILNNMYDVMCEEVPEAYQDDIMVSCRYPKLYPYMSIEAGAQIVANSGENATDWEKQTLAAWAYSFWARRHHDGVDGTAFKILKTIDKLYNK